MPYFKKEYNGEIVYRKHEFNAEVLNGEIIKIEDNHDCLIIAHYPNKQFGWNVAPLENIEPEKGLEKIEKLGTKDATKKGEPYYTLISSSLLNEYINSSDNLVLKTETPEEFQKSTQPEIKQKEPVEEISRRQETIVPAQENKKSRKSYKPKLVRDVNNEKPIKILM